MLDKLNPSCISKTYFTLLQRLCMSVHLHTLQLALVSIFYGLIFRGHALTPYTGLPVGACSIETLCSQWGFPRDLAARLHS